ncbi:unnamed protein product, partial [marine sediment metagenome]
MRYTIYEYSFALFIFRFITIYELGLTEKGNSYTIKLI